jgi:hypothetical protein
MMVYARLCLGEIPPMRGAFATSRHLSNTTLSCPSSSHLACVAFGLLLRDRALLYPQILSFIHPFLHLLLLPRPHFYTAAQLDRHRRRALPIPRVLAAAMLPPNKTSSDTPAHRGQRQHHSPLSPSDREPDTTLANDKLAPDPLPSTLVTSSVPLYQLLTPSYGVHIPMSPTGRSCVSA